MLATRVKPVVLLGFAVALTALGSAAEKRSQTEPSLQLTAAQSE